MLKRILSLLLMFVMAFSFGCKPDSDPPETPPQTPPAEMSYEVWSTYNTMRVVQDPALNGNYEKLSAKIWAESAKNELESAQLFITTDENTEIDYFMLVANDLKNENQDVFPADQVDVYVQRYVDITEHSYRTDIEEYPLGYMPDGLIPMDLSNIYGENVIAKNCNQGITVDFIVKNSTPAGTYTGNFTLIINDEEIDIPVELTVWDFALPEKSTCQSSVRLYYDDIMYGEMTTLRSEIDNLYKAYYDTLLRFKVNAEFVPYALVSPTALVNSVLEYWDHPNFATFGMPNSVFIGPEQNGYNGTFYDYYLEAMIGLAKNSNKDRILFDKMYFYVVDEPDAGVWGSWSSLDEWNEIILNLKDDVKAKLIADGFFNNKSEEFKEKLLYSLYRVENIVTTYWQEEREGLNGDITYCPGFSYWESYYQQLSIKNDAEENDNNMWYYTTIGPQSPYPTQFIDDFMITGREMKWMQKSLGLTGWLYYQGSASYILNATSVLGQNINPYDTAFRWENGFISNGDGYLVLPGARYGQKSPIATQRLLVYREGQDDLDMINYLDSIYLSYNDYYGVADGTISFDTVQEGLYDRMFCRAISYRSDTILIENREIIAQNIMDALTLDDKFAKTIEYSGDYATYKFYLAQGYSIEIDGTELVGTTSGSGNVYTYTVNLKTDSLLSSVKIVSSSDSRTVTLYDDVNTKAIAIVGDGAINAEVTENSSVTATEDALIFDIKSVDKGDFVDNMLFVPSISVNLDMSLRTIELDLENTEDFTVIMTLVLVGEDGSNFSADISLTANTKCTVEVLNRLADGIKVESFAINFENGKLKGETVDLVADRQIILSGIRTK